METVVLKEGTKVAGAPSVQSRLLLWFWLDDLTAEDVVCDCLDILG
jgi:hypothetical protein